jgi:hypothetical protein
MATIKQVLVAAKPAEVPPAQAIRRARRPGRGPGYAVRTYRAPASSQARAAPAAPPALESQPVSRDEIEAGCKRLTDLAPTPRRPCPLAKSSQPPSARRRVKPSLPRGPSNRLPHRRRRRN